MKKYVILILVVVLASLVFAEDQVVFESDNTEVIDTEDGKKYSCTDTCMITVTDPNGNTVDYSNIKKGGELEFDTAGNLISADFEVSDDSPYIIEGKHYNFPADSKVTYTSGVLSVDSDGRSVDVCDTQECVDTGNYNFVSAEGALTFDQSAGRISGVDMDVDGTQFNGKANVELTDGGMMVHEGKFVIDSKIPPVTVGQDKPVFVTYGQDFTMTEDYGNQIVYDIGKPNVLHVKGNVAFDEDFFRATNVNTVADIDLSTGMAKILNFEDGEIFTNVGGRYVKMTVGTSTSYTIKGGDTLNKIAADHGVSIWKIAEENGIDNVNKIFAGDTITIPSRVGIKTEVLSDEQPGFYMSGMDFEDVDWDSFSIEEFADGQIMETAKSTVMVSASVGKTLDMPKSTYSGFKDKVDSQYGDYFESIDGTLGDGTSLKEVVESTMYVESYGNIDAVSKTGVAGVMQITKSTALDAGCDYGAVSSQAGPAIECAAKVLELKQSRLLHYTNIESNNPDMATYVMASYNAGEGIISSAINSAENDGYSNPTWGTVEGYITPSLLKKYYPYNKWSDAQLNAKIKEIKRHTSRSSKYLSYSFGSVPVS